MTKLQGNSTAEKPGITCSKGTISPNLKHVEASLYPQAQNFYLWFSLFRKIKVQAFQLC